MDNNDPIQPSEPVAAIEEVVYEVENGPSRRGLVIAIITSFLVLIGIIVGVLIARSKSND